MKKWMIPILILSGIWSLGAQAPAQVNRTLDPAMRKFVQSQVMIKFKDLKREAENSVSAFKSEMNNYKPADIQKVKSGYERTADRFNQELENMKMDFMNKKKLKYIVEFPKDYARSLELNFRELAQFYAENFQQPLQDVRQVKEDGGIVIALFLELFKLVPEVINHFNEMREMSSRYDEAYLDKNLVTPFKFLTWAEIQAEAGYNNAQNFNNQYNTGGYNPYAPNPQPYDPNAMIPPMATQTGGMPQDSLRQPSPNWWENNATVSPPVNVDGSGQKKPSVSTPAATKPKAPDPFATPPLVKDTLVKKPIGKIN